jgi:hypothetical protein
MLYKLLKNLIVNNYFVKEDMTNKLNIFMLYNQITEDQYKELIALVNPIATTLTDSSVNTTANA